MKKQYIIEGKSWNGQEVRFVTKSSSLQDVVGCISNDFENPEIFDTLKEARAALKTAQSIATACDLRIIEAFKIGIGI